MASLGCENVNVLHGVAVCGCDHHEGFYRHRRYGVIQHGLIVLRYFVQISADYYHLPGRYKSRDADYYAANVGKVRGMAFSGG